MNIRMYLGILFLLYAPSALEAQTRPVMTREQKSGVSLDYLHSFATGLVIGSLTGISSSVLDRYTPFGDFIPFTWIGWHFTRNEIVGSIIEDMGKKKVHKTIMNCSAWVASWAVYIAHARYLGVGITERA